MIQLQEHRTPGKFSLFNLGFRPFFLGGAIASVLLMAVWLIMYSNGFQPGYYNYGVYWHAHEMIYGFTLAIIAGFLLTAVKNWTNVQTPYSWPLAFLFSLWLLGRLLPLFPQLPDLTVALIDLAFTPLLAFAISWPIIRAGNYRNLLFIPLLIGFFIGNLLIHLQLLGVTESTANPGIKLGLFLVVVIITLIGGRVLPFFTERGVPGVKCHKYDWIEKAIIPLSLAWLLLSLTSYSQLIAPLCFVLATANLLRGIGWFDKRIFSNPLVWILHAGYAFITLGYFLYGLNQLNLLTMSVAYHAFAAGGIGVLTLGMMSRVSLGHTGRPLKVPPVMVAAFILMLLAAVVRITIGLLPLSYLASLHLSGTLWIVAWLLFAFCYSAVLIKPRADGIYG
ncbi:MAG: hypothetical protein CSA60_03805 [Neptuniibacter caesariensis]|uniref:NnrS family protein n=1 Tax=Neptuniibacter caesariensis TaxID=207954 RepID=A0A2G6JMZ5_NEPCE|nr:MAG: hypothetical protein CSA60_03805 [Neptuniibacter caesariensis]